MKGLPFYAPDDGVFNEGFTKKGDFSLKNVIFNKIDFPENGSREGSPGPPVLALRVYTHFFRRHFVIPQDYLI
jgi:hypothetical protein